MVEYRILMDTSKTETFRNLERRLEQVEKDGFKLVGVAATSNITYSSSTSRTLIAIVRKG